MLTLDITEEKVVQIIATVVGSLSLIGSSIVIVSYFLLPKLKTKSRRLLVWLSVSDWLQSLFFVLALIEFEGIWCVLDALLGIFAACSSFLWTACVALFVFLSLSKRKRKGFYRKLFYLFHLICWGYPLGMVITVGVLHKTETTNNGTWCFIMPQFRTWTMLSVYGPLFFSWAVTTILYALTVIRLQTVKKTLVHQKTYAPSPTITAREKVELVRFVEAEFKEIQTKMILIPLLFILLRLPDTIYRIIDLSTSSHNDDSRFMRVLEIIMALCDPAQGIINCFIFVFLTPKVRKGLADLFRRDNQYYHPINRDSTEIQDDSS